MTQDEYRDHLLDGLRRLEADKRALLQGSEEQRSEIRAKDTRIGELERENEAVREDAERYRWLRKKVCIIGTEHLSYTRAVFEFVNLPSPTHIAPCAATELDASIDAARAARGGE